MLNVSRQYRSPTCLLDIAAVSSPLSQWTERSVLKQVRFQMRLLSGDVLGAEGLEQAIVIRGDRAQLEALCHAVDLYVQQQLMDDRRFESANLTADYPVEGSTAQLSRLEPKRTADLLNHAVATPASGIYLRPLGLLAHELVLGSLHSNTTSAIRLGMVQLSDLATVLDQYNSDNLALPVLTERKLMLLPTAQWRAIAALVILSVGTAGLLTRIAYNPVPTLVGSTTSESTSPNQPGSQLDTAQVPSENLIEKSHLSKASRGRFESTTPSSQANSRITIAVSPKSTVEPIAPGIAGPSFQSLPAGTSQRETRITLEQPQIALAPPISPPSGGVPPFPETVIASEPAHAPTSPLSAEQSNRQGNSAPAGDSSQVANDASLNQRSSAISGTIEAMPPPASAPPGQIVLRSPQSSTTNRRDSSWSISGHDRQQSSLPSEPVPQLAEIQRYFERTWQPTPRLTEPLEYVLWLKPDGSVQQVQPIGQIAQDYLRASSVPMPGQALTSPIATGRPLVVRLILSPNGQVSVSERIRD